MSIEQAIYAAAYAASFVHESLTRDTSTPAARAILNRIANETALRARAAFSEGERDEMERLRALARQLPP